MAVKLINRIICGRGYILMRIHNFIENVEVTIVVLNLASQYPQLGSFSCVRRCTQFIFINIMIYAKLKHIGIRLTT